MSQPEWWVCFFFCLSVSSLKCNHCNYGLLGICLSNSEVQCSTNTSVCFTGKASMWSRGHVLHLSLTHKHTHPKCGPSRNQPVVMLLSPGSLPLVSSSQVNCSLVSCLSLRSIHRSLLCGLQHAGLQGASQLQHHHERDLYGSGLSVQSGLLLHRQVQPRHGQQCPGQQDDLCCDRQCGRLGLCVGKLAVKSTAITSLYFPELRGFKRSQRLFALKCYFILWSVDLVYEGRIEISVSSRDFCSFIMSHVPLN